MIFFSFNFQYDMGPIWGKIEQNARKHFGKLNARDCKDKVFDRL